MKLEEEIKKEIEDYLELIDFETLISTIREDEDFSEEDLSNILDTSVISDIINNRLEQKIASFNNSLYSGVLCDKCGKAYGEFEFKDGDRISPEEILKPGFKIIVVGE